MPNKDNLHHKFEVVIQRLLWDLYVEFFTSPVVDTLTGRHQAVFLAVESIGNTGVVSAPLIHDVHHVADLEFGIFGQLFAALELV